MSMNMNMNMNINMNASSSSIPPHHPLENTTLTTTSTSIPAEQQQQQHRSMEAMYGAFFEDNGSGYSQGRWPRQETLTLLEIRSQLDPKFKESAHKAPLWDEVSRYYINNDYLITPVC